MPVSESDYQRVVDGIVTKIASGRYRPGAEPDERLPSRAELAIEYGTSISTVDRAMTVLHALRLIRGQQGKGTWVADGAPALARAIVAAEPPESPDRA